MLLLFNKYFLFFLERIVVVTEYNGDPLSNKENLNIDEIISITFQCLLGLQHMNKLDLVHRHLSPDNILINKGGNVQLYNFGLYYMTESGKNISFPIGYALLIQQKFLLLLFIKKDVDYRNCSLIDM